MRTRHAVSVIAALVVVAALGLVGHGYTLNTVKWSSSPVTIYMNPANLDVSASAAEAALKTAMDAWNTQGGSSFRFSYGGRVSDTTTGNDGRNVVIFRNATNGSALASTYSWYSGGSLIDSDTIFWDGYARFFTGTSGCASGAYVEDIAAHEFGHTLGLLHSTVAEATMYPSYVFCTQDFRTLAADDIAGVRALYPTTTNTAPSVTIVSPSDGASFIAGSPISFAGSASDSQDGNLTSSLSWTSSVDGAIGTGGAFSRTLSNGSHAITVSVRDSAGVLTTRQVAIAVYPAPVGPTLSVRTSKVRGSKRADLSWSGFGSSVARVDIYRDGVKIGTASSTSTYSDGISTKGTYSYAYQVCASGTATCTNTAVVTF